MAFMTRLEGFNFTPKTFEVLDQAHAGVVCALDLRGTKAQESAALVVLRLALRLDILDADQLRDAAIAEIRSAKSRSLH
jgi:hypothetical protein